MSDGDGEEMVIVSAYQRYRYHYHTDPDCSSLPEKPREWSRSLAEAWDITECRYCSGEYEVSSDDGFSHYRSATSGGSGGEKA